jgi:serine/threonine protein kinase
MEYMGGGTLTDILEVFPTVQMTESEIAYIMLEVSLARCPVPKVSSR